MKTGSRYLLQNSDVPLYL